jgi:hypothetical protein
MDESWREVSPEELPAWNERLFRLGAPLWQMPYWRGFLERPGLRATYLVQQDHGEPRAWACVLDAGLPGFRLGQVQDGPVNLTDPAAPVPADAVTELCSVCRARGFVFLRFTNSDELLLSARRMPLAVAGDLFPFFRRTCSPELHVPLTTDDEEMLRHFQWRARNSIKRAVRAGYEVVDGTDDELLEQAHELIVTLAHRRRFRAPPKARLAEMLRQGGPVGGARVYVARRPDGVPVTAIVNAADRSTSNYLFGATEPARLDGQVSPATLVHWTAMRHAAQCGMRSYNLGDPGPPSVGRFKERFQPIEVPVPPAVTVGLRPVAFAGWRHALLPLFVELWPAVQRARFELWSRRNTGRTRYAGDVG